MEGDPPPPFLPSLTAAGGVRRVRSAEGAKRYKQPIGSIIVRREGKDLNLSLMDDDHLVELMGDSAARDKNPMTYEAAFTEWAKRQPDVEPPAPEDVWPDDFPPDDADTVRLELL